MSSGNEKHQKNLMRPGGASKQPASDPTPAGAAESPRAAADKNAFTPVDSGERGLPQSAGLALFDQLPSMMWHAGPDGQCDYFNQAWLAFTGRALAEELGDGWTDGLHPDDRERCLSAYRQAFTARRPFEIEYRLRDARGEYCWILDVGRPLTDAEGHFSGFVGTGYDLTERKAMEKALLESNQALEAANAALSASEAIFKGLFEHAPDAIIAVGPDGRMILANEQAERMFGYTRAEMAGRPIELLMPADEQDLHVQHRLEYMREPVTRPMHSHLELYGRRKDGSSFPVEINLGPLEMGSGTAVVAGATGVAGGAPAEPGAPDTGLVILATVRDISERKQAEAVLKTHVEAIREREKLLTTAAESAPLVFFKIDREGLVQFSLGSSLSLRLTGEESVGRSIFEVYGQVPAVLEGYRRALAGERSTNVIEAGGLVYEATYAPMQNEAGEITSVVGVAADVTRHRQVESALEESERVRMQANEHFRTIFENAILGVFLIDPQGRIVETNRALQEMLGYSAEELRARQALDLLHPRELAHARERIQRLMSGHEGHMQVEQRYLRKDGQMLWGRLAMSLFRGPDGQPVYGIGMVENITAQKQAEAELGELRRRLIDSAELERRQLSQELHDGPLQDLQAMTFQVSMLEGLITDAEGQSEVEALREELARVARSIRAVCGDLRPPALAPFGLEKAIRSHAEQFREQHPELGVHLDLAEDNQALSERVRLALFRIYQHSLANIQRHAQARNVWIEFTYDDEHIRLRIADDGHGFKVPRRWIELVRQGHFGVVGSIERAESVGGKLEIQSTPGEGTLVTVTVPRKEEEQVSAPERFSAAR